MNERIKELAKQAGWGATSDPYARQAFDVNMFAKLVVEECMKINNQFIGHRIGEIDLDVVYREHFGVK